MLESKEYEIERHIDVLDGIRAVSLVFIVWFHIWEQSWLTPYIVFDNNIARYLNISSLNIHTLVQFGYTLVEMFILMSAIVNFLPYARSIVFGEPWPDTRTFYIKRAIRIIPSYLLCVLIMFIGALIGKSYGDDHLFMVKDLITHLTCTSTFFKDTYRITKLNGALWTIQVEVLWYLLIPLIAWLFKKWPLIVTAAMYLIGMITSNIIVVHSDDLWARNNFFFTFAGYYATGMLIGIFYYHIKSSSVENRFTELMATLGIVGSYVGFISILNKFYNLDRPYAQLTQRIPILFVMTVFTLGVMFSYEPVKKFFSNKVFKFISLISYNLYIWHQVVAVFLKEHHIPKWNGDTAPNELYDKVWMRKYFVLSLILGVLVSVAITYLFEIPVTDRLRRKYIDENGLAYPGKKRWIRKRVVRKQ